MARYDARDAEVLVFTFKEGLLSPVAHDLKLRVERFEIDVEEATVRAQLDARSLKVVAAIRQGRDDPGALAAASVEEIERNAAQRVLSVDRFPSIHFQSTSVDEREVRGRLTLCGQSRDVTGRRCDEQGRRVAEFRVDQREFGIRPFSAMLGALKIRPDVLVRVALPA